MILVHNLHTAQHVLYFKIKFLILLRKSRASCDFSDSGYSLQHLEDSVHLWRLLGGVSEWIQDVNVGVLKPVEAAVGVASQKVVHRLWE